MNHDPELLAALEKAVLSRHGTPRGKEIAFTCPAHDDGQPSARWHPGKNVWFCDVCGTGGGAFHLARLLNVMAPQAEPAGLSLQEFADYKALGVDFLRSVGITEGVLGTERMKCVDIPYLDEYGEIIAVRKRLRLEGTPRLVWRRGDKVSLYGLARLAEARSYGFTILVEGETDALTLWQTGLPGLGVPGAATWKEAWKLQVHDLARVYVWREPDEGGESLVARVSADLPDVRIIDAPSSIRDPNALWLSLAGDRDAFRQRMQELMEGATRASEIRSLGNVGESRLLYEKAKWLLEDPDLMRHIRQAMRATGYAGDLTPPMLAFISLTSRHQDRPLNLALIAQSASGKNRAVDTALALVPESAFYLEKAGSARALIYADADFQHRVVVVAEADSIPEDGSAASAVRSIAADSYMAYDVVEKDPESGRFVTRRVEKSGPTGLLTTYTRPLPEQMNTRMLTVSVSDTPDQTRQVLLAHAASVNGEFVAPDLEPFLALQHWLDIAGEHRVTIPYASALASLVPPEHVRMRRDFRQALTVIQTIAVLHQCQRQRDAKGRIVADLEDYRIARELLLDAFTAAATGGITASVRETAETLRKLFDGEHPLTVKALGEAMGVAKDTALHRVRRAISLGLVRNEETRRGQPARLVPGDALPEERPALPTVEELQTFVCVDLQKTGSTVQPEGSAESDPESEAPVENAVEPAIQPDFQPGMMEGSDSIESPPSEPVERSNADPEERHTYTQDEGDRVYAFALARERCFPPVRIKPGVSVLATEEAWQKFTGSASKEFIRLAIAALEIEDDAG